MSAAIRGPAGAGGGRGGVANDAGQHGGCLPALAAICAYEPRDCAIVDMPGPVRARPLVDGSAGDGFAALLAADGEVHCQGRNGDGQLGVGDRRPREGSAAALLPWPAAAVSCGSDFAVALRRGGLALCSWGHKHLGRRGRHSRPAEVRGLPRGDPIALLGVGLMCVIAVTRSGEAYGWGMGVTGQILGHPLGVRTPVRIAALSGLRLRRLVCGSTMSFAETEDGVLLGWGLYTLGKGLLPVRPNVGRLAHPLRNLTVAGSSLAAADARGRLWCLWVQKRLVLTRAALPAGELVAHAAGCIAHWGVGSAPCFVALTAAGRLWDVRQGVPCRSITSAHPGLPLGLLPCGALCARRVILIRDPSCGLQRCKLLLLAAGRLELLPADEQMVRIALRPFLVDDAFVFASDGADADESSEEGGEEGEEDGGESDEEDVEEI